MNYLKPLTTFLLGMCTCVCLAQSPDHFTCHIPPEEGIPGSTEDDNQSINGQLTTPDGTLNCLIVFAGFEGFDENPNTTLGENWTHNWRSDNGPTDYELPNYVVYNPSTGETTMDEFMFTDPDILQPNIVNPSTNVSNMMYLMSRPNREFKLVGSVFSGPDGVPRQVIIPQNRFNEMTGWTSTNDIVVSEMGNTIWGPGSATPAERDAYFAQFDNRENNPSFDHSVLGTEPDGIIDVVVFIYRYSSSWSDQPRAAMPGWLGSNGGYYSESITNVAQFSHGFAIPQGSSAKNIFPHELAHGLYDSPHLCGSNYVSGDHFNLNMVGMGLTSGNDNYNPTHAMMSSWERWYNGFIDPLEISEGQSTYLLRDYVTTGDALRIEIPFSELDNGVKGKQHLWIQNHAGDHPLYEHELAGFDLLHWDDPEDPTNDHVVSNSDKGLYMYIEDVANTIDDIDVVRTRPGEMLLINPMGNWDIYRDIDVPKTRNKFEARMLPFRYIEENPITGTNPWLLYRGDVNEDANMQTDGEISFDPDEWNATGGGAQEGDLIYREEVNGALDHTYARFGIGGGVRPSAFLAGDELNMGTNPTITNFPRYTGATASGNAPYYLTGLSVKIVSNGPQAQVQVKYKQTGVNNHVRWTGDIVLPDITESNLYDLVLADDKQITLDLSRTPQRESINPITGDFVNPTKLTIRGDAGIHLKRASRINIGQHASLIIEDGAKVRLDDYACIIVNDGGTLELKGNDISLLGPEAVIIVKEGGKVKTADGVDFTFTGSGYASFHKDHIIELGENSHFVLIRPETNNPTRFLQLKDGASLKIENRNITLANGLVRYYTDSEIHVTDGRVNLDNITGLAFEGPQTSRGVIGINSLNFSVTNSRFTDFEVAASAISSIGHPYLSNNALLSCKTGFSIFGAEKVNFLDNIIRKSVLDGIHLRDIKTANIINNDINGVGSTINGINASSVRFAKVSNSRIDNCAQAGIYARHSNFTLGEGTEIYENNYGVHYYENQNALFFLAVGKCTCAHIYKNKIGVIGDNIILEIDGDENQIACNEPVEYYNSFHGNEEIFSICYTDPNYQVPNQILMKSNYWGGGPISNYNYSITQAGCSIPVNVDDSNFSTTPVSTGDCEVVSGIVMVSDPTFSTNDQEKVRYDYQINNTTVEVHEQFRIGYFNHHYDLYPAAKEEYKEIAFLDKNIHQNDRAFYKIDVARCMVEAYDQIEASANLYNEESETATLLESNKFSIFPNPADNIVTIKGDKKADYQMQVFGVLGNLIKQLSFTEQSQLDVSEWISGLYMIRIENIETKKVITKKLVVRE